MATVKKESAAGPAEKGLKVTSRPPTFRRAGYSFSGEARVIPLSELTQEQVKALKEDPNLVCQEVDMPAKKSESAEEADKA